jgi:hypothetical protein
MVVEVAGQGSPSGKLLPIIFWLAASGRKRRR